MKDYVTPAPFVVYGKDGEIEHAGQQGIAFTTDRMVAGERILLVENLLTFERGELGHYVDVATRAVCAKTECPAILDGLTLRALPVPCRIEVANPSAAPSLYAWTEPSLTLSFAHPGRYAVRVLSAPHRPGVFEVQYDG